jgi:hypothetical protein
MLFQQAISTEKGVEKNNIRKSHAGVEWLN